MRGNLVTIRSLLPEDSDSYFEWINNKALVLKNSDYKPISKTDHEKWFNTITQHQNLAIFSIVANETNKLIGSCSLRNINQHHKNAELQIRIGDFAYHNRGFGSEATTLLVQYGFNVLNLKRIYLHVFCTNHRAIRAYEKCQFILEGILKKAAYIEGAFIDVALMAIIND